MKENEVVMQWGLIELTENKTNMAVSRWRHEIKLICPSV